MFVTVYLCNPFSSYSGAKDRAYYTYTLLLDFWIAFVVDIHACHNFGDNRHDISMGFATRVCDDCVQQDY
jgi:hypothetical protein